MIFATPDFGASGAIVLALLVVSGVALAIVVVGISWGTRLLGSGSPKARKQGVILVLGSLLLPLSCCLLPPQAIYLMYGNYPLGSYPNNKIQKGMSAAEVKALLGRPHESFKQDQEEKWYYWIDSFGMHWFGVHFGHDGRVTSTGGN
jgi:hypothetical protein